MTLDSFEAIFKNKENLLNKGVKMYIQTKNNVIEITQDTACMDGVVYFQNHTIPVKDIYHFVMY
jgi:hypothetical protein